MLRKTEKQAQRDVIRQHQLAILDQQFQLDAPLLTSSRCEALSKAFELQGGGQCALPLLAAYECMFSATEREEYPVEFFKADLHETFNATQQHGFLSLQEAIHFLEANQ